jgi:hypothetical protein
MITTSSNNIHQFTNIKPCNDLLILLVERKKLTILFHSYWQHDSTGNFGNYVRTYIEYSNKNIQKKVERRRGYHSTKFNWQNTDMTAYNNMNQSNYRIWTPSQEII